MDTQLPISFSDPDPFTINADPDPKKLQIRIRIQVNKITKFISTHLFKVVKKNIFKSVPKP